MHKLWREHLHIASENHEIDIAFHEFQHLGFGLGLGVFLHGHIEKRNPETAHSIAQLRVVTEHHGHVHGQLTALGQGPIIEQDVIRVSHRQDVDDLKTLGADIERQVLSRAVKWHLEDRILVDGNKTIVMV